MLTKAPEGINNYVVSVDDLELATYKVSKFQLVNDICG